MDIHIHPRGGGGPRRHRHGHPCRRSGHRRLGRHRVAVLVFVFGEAPGEPPISALLIILAVDHRGSFDAGGRGVDWMVKIAAGVIQRHPKQITLIAPLTAFSSRWVRGRAASSIPSCQ